MIIHQSPSTEYDLRYNFFRKTQEFQKMHRLRKCISKKQFNMLFTEMRL